MQRYSTARSLNQVMIALGWLTIAFSAIVLIVAFQRAGALGALVTAVPTAIGGLVLVALAQMSLAQLDTAENTAETVTLLQQLVKAGKASSPAPVNTPHNPSAPRVGDAVKTYKGRRIIRENAGVSVDGREFGNVIAAEKWIDEQIAKL
ncbi:hypothetical protein LCM17_13055 [Cereibacter sphaeroides]|nr:hypothetical protein [Cereibacter sphaeroides]